MVVFSQENRVNVSASKWIRIGRGLVLGVAMVILGSCSKRGGGEVVVVYTSQDQLYATEILRVFTRDTGIEVLPLFDSESVKTTGLVNRLLAERHRPRCDVFWSNEEMMLRRLAKKGIVEEGDIVTFGYRTRRLVVNTNWVELRDTPDSIKALTDSRWKRRVALAYPLYGTTATHLMVLRARWGEEPWQTWCRDLLGNEALVVDGNSAVVRMVGRGEAWMGLTDSDDIAVGLRNGLPLRQVDLTPEFPPIANSAALIVGGPHPKAARVLVDYLQERSTIERMVELGALEGNEFSEADLSPVDWDEVLRSFDEAYRWLGEVFFR